jgi:hypothetical protein
LIRHPPNFPAAITSTVAVGASSEFACCNMCTDPKLYRRVADVPVLTRRDAPGVADKIFNILIPALQRDAGLPSRSDLHWRLALADPHRRITELLASLIDNRADLHVVLRLLQERRS